MHSNSFLLYCVILWLPIKYTHIYTHFLNVKWRDILRASHPTFFKLCPKDPLRVSRKLLRDFLGVVRSGRIYSSMGKAEQFCKGILIQDSSWLSHFDVDLVSWHGYTKWPRKTIKSLVAIISNVSNIYPWFLFHPNPYSCYGGFHFPLYSLTYCLNFYAYLLFLLRKILKIFLRSLIKLGKVLRTMRLISTNQHYVGILWNENVYYQKFWENW